VILTSFFNIDIPDLLVVGYITAYNSIDGLLALPFIDYFEIQWRNWGLELILPPYIISYLPLTPLPILSRETAPSRSVLQLQHFGFVLSSR